MKKEKIILIGFFAFLGLLSVLISHFIVTYVQYYSTSCEMMNRWKETCGWVESADIDYVNENLEEWKFCYQLKLIISQISMFSLC